MICPWTEDCAGRLSGIGDELPRRKVKAERPRRKGIAFWVEREDGMVLLRERPDKGLLGGMMEIPSTEWTTRFSDHPEAEAPITAAWQKTGKRIEHTFTHFHLTLDIWRAQIGREASLPAHDYRWVPAAALSEEALPSVMRKIVVEVTSRKISR